MGTRRTPKRNLGRVGVGLVLALASCKGARPDAAPVGITMEALHQSGGVPPAWQFTPPPGNPAAGRALFVDLGCYTCHTVSGEQFPAPEEGETSIGPDLTGMGAHHPPGYFAESIVSPDAVLVIGPGYIGPDGRSIMPTYPDMTLAQLADLVAYVKSLSSGGHDHGQHHHVQPNVYSDAEAANPDAPRAALPAAPPNDASMFLARAYDVKDGKLPDFVDWFNAEGAVALLRFEGLLTVQTYVDRTRQGPRLLTVFGFTDEAALDAFLNNPAVMGRFAEFVEPKDDYIFGSPPVYKADDLSAP